MMKLIFRTVSQPVVRTIIGQCDICHYGCECGAEFEYELMLDAELDPDPWDNDCDCECGCDEFVQAHPSYVCGYENHENFAEYAPEELRPVFKSGYLTVDKSEYGGVYGYVSCLCTRDITDNQIRQLKGYLGAQLSDGIGESLEQTQVLSAYYISWLDYEFKLVDIKPIASN